MGLITTIWVTLNRFKESEESKKTQGTFSALLDKITCYGWGKAAFFMLSFTFQVPLFIWISYHTVNTDRLDFTGEPQVKDVNIYGWSQFVAIFACIFMFGYVFLMLAQVPSFTRQINNQIRSKITRSLIYLILFVLFLFYLNDIIAMHLFYWGAPAFVMTKYSMDPITMTTINDDAQCRSMLYTPLLNANYDTGMDFEMTASGRYLKFNIQMTQASAVLWTLVFCFGFFEL